jgi:hypothetical protein
MAISATHLTRYGVRPLRVSSKQMKSEASIPNAKPFMKFVRTYTELQQQIHDDLRIQHPEWVERNGESSMRLLEQLDTFDAKGIQRVYNGSSSKPQSRKQPPPDASLRRPASDPNLVRQQHVIL